MRRVHWKATARLGVPVSRRYDPAHERELLIAVDMQTLPGVSWMLNWDDDLVQYISEEFKKEQGADLRKDPMALQRLKEAAEKAESDFERVFTKKEIPELVPEFQTFHRRA